MESLKRELQEAREELKDFKKEQKSSFNTKAFEDYKRANKRLFISWLVTSILLVLTLLFFNYL